MRRCALLSVLLVIVVGCEDKPAARPAADAAPSAASVPSAVVSAPAVASVAPSAQPDAAARFDPKHKCPTGQTHFYLEGDFCRRKCMTTSDCGKRERCSAIEYPFIMNGQPAGFSKFCEGY
jgi:hypothetical protein